MSAHRLLAKLRREGAFLVPDGKRLRIDAPEGLLTKPLLDRLARLKPEILEQLRLEREAVAALSLEELSRAGLIIRVYSTVLGREVLFVSDNVPDEIVERQALPVYRTDELRKLAILRPAPHSLRRLHEVKEVFRGTIEAIEDRSTVEIE